jgi:hypothetical protein
VSTSRLVAIIQELCLAMEGKQRKGEITMKVKEILKTIILTELAISIPLVTGIYAWGMLGFQPETETKCTTVGTFGKPFEATDTNGNEKTLYQFKSNDNETWWQLTAEEIGFIPNGNTEYVLTYDNNGTTKENKPCDCDPELDCECELYDDVFLSVKRK